MHINVLTWQKMKTMLSTRGWLGHLTEEKSSCAAGKKMLSPIKWHKVHAGSSCPLKTGSVSEQTYLFHGFLLEREKQQSIGWRSKTGSHLRLERRLICSFSALPLQFEIFSFWSCFSLVWTEPAFFSFSTIFCIYFSTLCALKIITYCICKGFIFHVEMPLAVFLMFSPFSGQLKHS